MFGQSTFGAKPVGFSVPFGSTPTTSSGFTGFSSNTFGTPAASTATNFGSTFGTPAANTFGAAAANTFGAPAVNTFGAPAANTFGAPTASTFGAPGASTFGAPGASTFGTPAGSSAPVFANTFGTPGPATSAPTFGSTFAGASTSAPTFGSTFGATTTSAPSLFGTPTTKPSLFGTPSSTGNIFSSAPTTSNLFGATAPTTTQALSLFGTTPTPSLFGTATTSAPSLFGGTTFGTVTSAPSTSGLFGATPAPTFGGSNFGTGLFSNQPTTTAPSLFGGFGATAQPATGGFGSFGTTGTGTFTGLAPTTTTGLFGGFGATATRPAIATPALPTHDIKQQQVLASIYAINIYGDERDNAMKKWNMLQACWGTGKGYYSNNQPPVEYDHTNPFYRFKAVCYSVLPTSENADGLVKLQFNKKESDLSPQKDVLINGIAGILGNRPNLTINIEHIKAISDNEAEVMISVNEKGITGASRKIYASDLSNFFNQPVQKQQLSNVGVTYIGPFMAPSKAQVEEYLKTPPPGIDLPMWQAAQIDNPNPAKYIPTPMFGFDDLKKRMVCQEYETGLHNAFLAKATDEITALKQKQAMSVAQLTERKQKLAELQHRVLKILIKQEAMRKMGMAVQPEEDSIRTRLESLRSQLSVSTQFRGKLQEVVSTVRLMDTLGVIQPTEQYRLEPTAKEDIRQFIKMEQTGIKTLIDTVNTDLKDLKTIQDGLSQNLSDTTK